MRPIYIASVLPDKRSGSRSLCVNRIGCMLFYSYTNFSGCKDATILPDIQIFARFAVIWRIGFRPATKIHFSKAVLVVFVRFSKVGVGMIGICGQNSLIYNVLSSRMTWCSHFFPTKNQCFIALFPTTLGCSGTFEFRRLRHVRKTESSSQGRTR